MILHGKKVSLRPVKPSDYKWLHKLVNDKRVTKYLLISDPISLAKEKSKVAKMCQDKNAQHFIIEKKEVAAPIGIMTIKILDKKNQRGSTGAFLDPKYWSQGYGADAKMTLLKYAFIKLNLNRIESYVFKHNPRSVAYSKKCGYHVEGLAKQRVIKAGKFLDEYVLAVLKKDWLKLAKKYGYI